jgi:ankyrin repeat protein
MRVILLSGYIVEDFLEYVMKNNMHAVQSLVDDGIDIRVTDNEGKNALHLAMQMDLVSYLLGLKQELNSVIEARDKNDNTPLILSVQKGLEIFKSFLTIGEANINALNNRGFTALHTAVDHGHIDIVEYILGSDVDNNVEIDAEDTSSRNTPLHYAAQLRETKMVALLLENGARADHMNDLLMTPRDKTDHEEIRKMLGTFVTLFVL